MPLVINSNISSLTAQRALNQTQRGLSTALQRLASGYRINSAKDDAAGLAISDRMTAQIRGMNQASRNANDAISLAQTAEGALQETTNLLQRIRELSVQSANDTNTSSDRASLQAEAAQLISELGRIATTTKFNGKLLLDNSFGTSLFHVGADAGQTISVTIGDARSTTLGANATFTSTGTAVTDAQAAASLTSPSGVLSLNGTAITVLSDGVSTTDATASAKAVAAGVNAVSSTTNVTAVANATSANLGTITADVNGLAAAEFQINGVSIVLGAIATGDADGALTAAINAVVNQTGVSAALNSSSQLVLTASDGRNIQLTSAGTNAVDVFSNFDITLVADDDVVVGTVTFSSDAAIVVDTGLVRATHGMLVTATTTAVTSANAVSNIDVSTQSGANSAISAADRALGTVGNIRGDLGALQSRFESTISNLQSVAENLASARSRIRDADFATETAELTRSQVLEQAGLAILTQAKSSQQNVLSLLQ